MSCSLQLISRLVDVNQLEDLLRGEDLQKSDEEIIDQGFLSNDLDDGWNDSGWEDTDDVWSAENVKAVKETSKSSWLQDCIVTLSPTEETFVIVKRSKAIIYSRKFRDNNTSVYEYVWHGYLKPPDMEDEVTCIICIPLASQQRSSEGNPDWTCIIAGYASGYVRMYMINGKLLLSQFLHNGPVNHIKAITKLLYSTKPSKDQVAEELFILYANAIVSIDGLGLYQSLRACRNQLAKAHASSFGSENITPPPLAYHKWTINEHQKINDANNCGMFHPCLFDRMQKSCFVEGVKSSVKGSTPSYHHFVAIGKAPFMSVHQAVDGSGPAFSDVAMAVANKLTSAVFSRISAARSLFGVAASSPQQSDLNTVKQKVDPGIALKSRYCLQDSHREAERIIIAPIGNLAAVADAFNRVLLFDTQTGIVVRMWKGYRDAECGWIVAEEEFEVNEDNSLPKRALFLVVYAPKRGILSIFLMENGGRVGAFNVGKDCKLLYPGYGVLGSAKFGKDVSCNNINQCFLLKSDGSISSIHIPFHCALSPSHSIQAKDLHLLKKVNLLIERTTSKDKTSEICKTLGTVLSSMQVPSTQRKAVDAILESKLLSPEFMKNVLEEMIVGFQKNTNKTEGEFEDLEYEAERQYMLQYCMMKKQLVDSYLFIQTATRKPDIESSNDGEDLKQHILSLLHITNTEADELLKSLRRYKDICLNSKCQSSKVSNEKKIDIASFLDCFDVSTIDEISLVKNDATASSSKNLWVCLKVGLLRNDIALLGAFLFEDCLEGRNDISELMLTLESSMLPPAELMHVLSIYTQSEHCVDILEIANVVNLHSIISSICSIKGGAEQVSIKLSVGDISEWWQNLRNVLADSVLIAHSLVMAFICRGVSMEMSTAAEKLKEQDESELSTSGWETVTVEMEKWNFLISQVENLLELDIFIHTNHETQQLSGLDYPTFHQHLHHTNKLHRREDSCASSKSSISQSRLVTRMPPFSVSGVLDAGYGAFALIVADSLVRQGVPGPCLGNQKRKKTNTILSNDMNEENIENEDVPEESDTSSQQILSSLSAVRELFPYSLSEDLLWTHCAWECIMVWKEDVEDICMLTSGLVHLSCIHNSIIQHGLGVMMWKAVFQETIKGLHQLTDKVGKSPKDRLCRKNLGLSYNALEIFLTNAKQLLEILLEIDVSDDEQLVLRTEELWARENCTQASLVEQAADQAFSDEKLISHNWLLVVSLLLVLNGNVRSIKPTNLFDTKGKHALHQPLHAVAHLSAEIDDKIMKYREQFCINAAECLINSYISIHTDEDDAKAHTSTLLDHLYLAMLLAERFSVDHDRVRRNISCTLYTVGLDIPALEMFLLIEDKETFLSQILIVIRRRLANKLLSDDAISESLSKLPTSISSWLQTSSSQESKEKVATPLFSIPLSNTFHILQSFHSNVSSNAKEYRFLNELIDSLRIFL